jgi:serine/threonine-protein kinase HipA
VERFDRIWSGERLIRRPQEDMCQALGIPWTKKYENEGGPGILRILSLLKSSQDAANDRRKFLTAQILFWILGATDGHAKNFSIHLSPGGLFVMAPLYDVLSAQPNVDLKQIRLNGFKLTMAVGDKRYYAMKSIAPRHYRQMADSAGMAQSDVDDILARLSSDIPSALERTIAAMPRGFPSRIAESIAAGATRRLSTIAS